MLTDQHLLILGAIVFGLLVTGLVMTALEFRQNILPEAETGTDDRARRVTTKTKVAEDRR